MIAINLEQSYTASDVDTMQRKHFEAQHQVYKHGVLLRELKFLDSLKQCFPTFFAMAHQTLWKISKPPFLPKN